MENLIQAIQNITNQILPVVVPLAVLLLVISGIWWMIAGRRGDDGPKELIKKIAIGIAIALSATTIANFLSSTLKF